MGLFNKTKAEEARDRIVTVSDGALGLLKLSIKTGFDSIWNNPDATPQEVLDTFGTEACILFDASSKTQEFIKSLDPNYTPLVPNKEFTINEDGTVTVKIEESINE
jgi:hypothetical protein